MGAIVAQSVSAAATSSATALTTASRTTAASGSLFVILSVWQRTGTDAVRPTFTDSKGNVYTNPGSPVFVTQGGFSAGMCMAYCANATGGAGHTFTQSKTDQYGTMVVLEITGYDGTTPIEALVAGNDADSPWLCPAVVSTVDDALIVASVQAGDTPSYVAESPSTMIVNLGYPSAVTYWGMAVETYVQATAGSFTAGFSGSGGFQSAVQAFAVRPFAPSGNTGTGAVTTDAASVSGQQTNIGTAAVSTDDATVAGGGSSTNLGTGGATTDDAAAIGAGVATNLGEGGGTTDATVSGSEGASNSGAGSVTTDDAAADASGVVSNLAAGDVTTDDATVVATGAADGTLHGSGDVTTEDSAASGVAIAANVATGAITTDAAVVNASGKQPIDSESGVKLLIPVQMRLIIVPARKSRLVMPKSVN
jgi:hypothetical protein